MNTRSLLQSCSLIVLATFVACAAYAAPTNVVVSGRACVSYANASTVGYQTNINYLKVKFPTATDVAKSYLEFDLTGISPNTNATAQLAWRTISSSGAESLQIWALNQAFAGAINDVTWNDAPANATGLNDAPQMLASGPATATLLVGGNYGQGAFRSTTDLPSNWGQFIFNNKLVLAITCLTNGNGASSANGYRIDFTNSIPTNLPTLYFSDLSGGLPPTITSTTNVTTHEYHAVGPIPFQVGDADSGAAAVTLSAVSDNPAVVSNSFTFATINATNRTLSFSVSKAGSAEVRVWASDGSLSNSTAFTVTVLPDPALTAPAGTNTLIGAAGSGSFTVSDVDDPSGNSLVTSARSLDLGIISDANVSTSGTGVNRTVTVTPTAADGVATVQVTVSDGGNSNSTLFAVMTLPNTNVYFSDHFSYPVGSASNASLLEASGGFWAQRSSGSVSLRTTNSSALIRSSSSAQSLIGPLAGAPYASGAIYFGFKATWLDIAGHSGADFIHLYDGANRVARIATETNGLATDSFRLLCGNAATSGLGVGLATNELTTNVTYTIIVRYDNDTPTTRLWINPGSELDSYTEAFDISVAGLSITDVGLRQNTSMGTILIDDLKVGANFAEVVPPPVTTPVIQSIQYAPGLTNGTVNIIFTGAATDSPNSFRLLTGQDVTGPFLPSSTAEITRVGTTLFQATHVTAATQRYYRIQR